MIDNFYSKLDTWMKSDDYKYHLKLDNDKRMELKKFISKFNLDYLKVMPINEYVTGMNNRYSFCNYVENIFKNYGTISGRTTAFQKFVIYWSSSENKYSFGDKRTKYRKGFGSTVEEIYSNVRNNIVKIVEASNNNDYKTIADSPLNPQFKNKIAFLYNYENQLPIYSNDDLNVILSIFDIPFDKNEDRAFKRKKLFDFYKVNKIDELISTDMFMSFIYGWYGYRGLLRSDEKPTIKEKVINEYSMIDVQIDDVIHTVRTGKVINKRVVYNPDSEENKRITGRKAEDIVIEYLKLHKKELNIKDLFFWCNGENKDDGRGYDISYVTTDGIEFYIEVKGTKMDLKNQVCFEMSANEYSVMRANEDNYYIYFVNDVNNGKIIRRILGKDIYGEEPTKYKINFDSKNKLKEI